MIEDPKYAGLVDIRTVAVDKSLPRQERLNDYIRQIKNPFLYKCGKFIVRSRFLKKGPSLEDSLQRMMY